MKVLGVFLLIFGLGCSAMAEYRAFELKISKKLPDGKPDPAQFRLVLSTLDPLQYYGYYIVRQDEVVQYTRTWMCKEQRTDEKPICPDPKQVAADADAKGEGRAPTQEPLQPAAAVPVAPRS